MAVIDETQLNSKDLLFLSNETKSFQFTLHPSAQEMGKTIQVYTVTWYHYVYCKLPIFRHYQYSLL